MVSEIEKWAWFYHKQGFSIIPLKEKEKIPSISKWEQYQKRQPTEDEIKTWFNQGLFKNIGIICGRISNNLVVIDVDDPSVLKKLGLKVETIIKEGHWIVRTRRGYHIYCRHNADPGPIIKNDILHIEYRGNGGYVVAPPSIHPSGAEYHFLYHETPDTLKVLVIEDVRKIFDDMVTRLQGPVQKPKKTLQELKKGVRYGVRNDTAFKLSCSYRDKGLSIEETTKLMMSWNQKNRPPLHDRELLQCIHSAYKRETRPNRPNQPNLPNLPNKPNLEDDTYLIKHFLTKPKRQYQNIGRGIHNGVCYIATYIEDDEGRSRTAIVTSDRKMYIDMKTRVGNEIKGVNQIKEVFGLYYRESYLHEIVETDWSNEIINKWLFEDYKVNLRNVFDRLVSTIKNFMIYEDERIYSCLAVDILRSYFFFLFNANSRTHFFAEPGSGKTNQINIFRALMFKPIASPDFSSASVYRVIEGTGGTVLIDDFDDLPDEEKQRLNRHIKVNYKRFKAVRSDGGRNFKPQGYDAFSHLVLNNTTGIEDPITKERVVTYKLLKHKDAPEQEVDYRDPSFQPLRDDCYICLLQYWKEVQEIYNSIKISELRIRDLENWKPQLSIAKLIGEDVFKDILSFAVEYVEQERLQDLTDDWEYLLLEYIVKELDWVDNDIIELEFSPNLIAQFITDRLYSELPAKDRDKKLHQLRIFIGGRLNGYTIFRKTRPQNCIIYHISRFKLRKILENKHFIDIFAKEHPWVKQVRSVEHLTYPPAEIQQEKQVRSVRLVRLVRSKPTIQTDTSPSLNEKIQNCIEIIKENPEDNYKKILDRYGQNFIDKMLEQGLFQEPVCGRKLEFVGR